MVHRKKLQYPLILSPLNCFFSLAVLFISQGSFGLFWGEKSCSLVRSYLAVLSAAGGNTKLQVYRKDLCLSVVLVQPSSWGRTCQGGTQTGSMGLLFSDLLAVPPSRRVTWAAQVWLYFGARPDLPHSWKTVPRPLTKLCLAFSCLKQTVQEKPVGKCNCFVNRFQGTESQVTVIESSILQLWEAYQRREGITDMGDCRTCFCRSLSRFHFGGVFVLLK